MPLNYKEFPIYAHNNETLADGVKKANDWLAKVGVSVVNVETKTTLCGGGVTTIDQQVSGVRVWYVEK